MTQWLDVIVKSVRLLVSRRGLDSLAE